MGRVASDQSAPIRDVLAYREGYIPILDIADSQLSESRSSEYEKENVFFDLVQEYLDTAPDYFTTRQLFLKTRVSARAP